ncbi:MAG: M60 family metallopeptidase, partial [Clostridia bacterium]|nr:M60 family metallopeptidase [Clostridia bacterium]
DEYEAVSAGAETFYPESQITEREYDTKFETNTQVGYYGRVIGSVERVVPTKTRDEGLGAYPKYGSTLSSVVGAGDDKKAMRQALINESDYFCAQGTRNNSGNGNNGDGTFTWMDENGNLFRGTRAEPVPATDDSGMQRKLYKHSASVGMYLEGFGGMPMLSADEPGIIKQVTIRPRGYGSYSVTGVYAPAGEVIKIQISEADMNATGGLTIHIGQALYNGQSNNIWADKGQMQRFPNILNTMVVNKNTAVLENGVYTAYVGSFLGGPVYIRNTNATFTATISGGVAYSHFILGVTTKEEFEQNNQSTAPYFDLEVWHNGVLHSGPKYYAKNFTYEQLYEVAVLWDKVASVTTTGSSQGIVFLYDPFVAAGAAVAFPGRSSVNCPSGWMSNSLNYNGIITSGGWGNFHEYHHNFQGYGVGNGGEVTNNGMTLVSYALFTKISSKRGMGRYGGQG